MSASREKKQRQGAGPSEKTAKVQQEQAARKRTTLIYSAIAAVIAVLVIALLVWRSGVFQSRATAAKLGSETLSTAELSYYYYAARQNIAMYAAYGLYDFDTSVADDQQFFSEPDRTTYRDYFLEQALSNAQQHKAFADEALRQGHTEADVKADVDEFITQFKAQAAANNYSYAAYLRAMYGPYMTTGIFEKLTTRYELASLMVDDKYDELYNGFTQADLDAYYNENSGILDTIEYSYLYFPAGSVETKDADGNDLPEDEVTKLKDEAMATANKNAEEALLAVKDGSSFDAQKDKYNLTTAGDHVTVVGTESINSSFSAELLGLSNNEPALVDGANGYYVIALHGRYLSDEPTRDVRHILAKAENTTNDNNTLVAPTDEAWAAAKAKMDEIQAAWDGSAKTEDAFAQLANEMSDDAGGSNGGLFERNTTGYFVLEFEEWVFDSSRKPGDVGMVQHVAEDGSTSGYYGYHLIYYVGENEPVWMGTARSNLAKLSQQTWMDGLTADYPATAASGADYLGR